jgi:hypothetical protein
LHDDRLFDSYFAQSRGEPLDPRVAEHLADCDRCGERFAEVERVLTAVARDADAEVDELFPPERLRAQQQEIARRLEHVGHVARVLSFPSRFAGRHMSVSGPRIVTRWVAAAAAAGLFIGVAAGRFFDQSGRSDAVLSTSRQAINAARPPRLAPVAIIATDGAAQTSIDPDEYFMSDLELALDGPRTRELLPFDALTPHVREIRDMR